MPDLSVHMNGLVLLNALTLAAYDDDRDPADALRELVESLLPNPADSDTIAAAALAVIDGLPAAAAVWQLTQSLHGDVEALAAEAFAASGVCS
jgi:hypothetical protein